MTMCYSLRNVAEVLVRENLPDRLFCRPAEVMEWLN